MPKFRVFYNRHLSTTGQEIDVSRDVEMEFKKQPTRKDFSDIERMLEDEFLRKHRKNIKRNKHFINVSYKVKKVVPVK